MEANVLGARTQEFVVSAHCGDAAIFQYDNAISDLEGIEPVRNDESRPVPNQLAECLVNERFAFDVGLAGEFIENENPRVAKDRPRQGQALLLTPGKLRPGLANARL